MANVVLDGPPWCGFVDPDEAYFRGQAASVGSGLLGGWDYATSGGFFEGRRARERAREVRQELARMTGPATAPPEEVPAQIAWHARLPPERRLREGRVQTLRPDPR
jgi:hypothetical protein